VNNRVLLSTTMMTPSERAQGRFMRAPDHPTGDDPPPQGSDSSSASNNTDGNPADSPNDKSGEDNSGLEKGLEGFWETKPEEGKPGESDDQTTQASQALGGELKQMIDNFAPPSPVFSKEIAEKIAEGDFDAANQAMAASHKATIQTSVMAAAKLVGAVAQRMQADFDQRINAAFGNKDNSDFLQQNFPQAKNPALAPMVERVWNQSLLNTKGDRKEAVKMTRAMLNAMGTEFAPDDIRRAPDDSTAGVNTAASRSFVDSLLER